MTINANDIITVIALASLFLNFYQIYQSDKRYRMDYLRNLQKELLEQKAKYDAWAPVWDIREGDSDPARHGIYVCSLAQSIMFSVNDSELKKLAGKLELHAGGTEGPKVIENNQAILERGNDTIGKTLGLENLRS